MISNKAQESFLSNLRIPVFKILSYDRKYGKNFHNLRTHYWGKRVRFGKTFHATEPYTSRTGASFSGGEQVHAYTDLDIAKSNIKEKEIVLRIEVPYSDIIAWGSNSDIGVKSLTLSGTIVYHCDGNCNCKEVELCV